MAPARGISGETLAAISQELVSLLARCYGKGPIEAKSYLCDDWLLCVLKGGLTAVEETLLEHDEHRLVRKVRLRFQEHMADSFTGAVERLSGRQVLSYHSQVTFDPDYSLEFFLLGPSVGDAEKPEKGSDSG